MFAGKWITGCWVAAIFMTAAAVEARPAGAGFYVGGAGGSAKYDQDLEDFDSIARVAFVGTGLPAFFTNTRLDDSDQSFNVFAGYRFNRFLAVEAGYVDLGEMTYQANFTVFTFLPAPQGTLRLNASSRGAVTSVLGIWPVSDFVELYARGGFFIADTEVSATATFGTFSTTESDSQASVDPLVGVGAAVNLGRHASLRLEYERFGAVGDEDTTGETNVDLFSLGVVVKF